MKLVSVFLSLALADVYFHFPRGANNRCDEKSNDRNNDKRLYDTENNSAGGYAWCDSLMTFYTTTKIDISWYSQHSCVECQHILQLGCQETFDLFAGKETGKYTLTDGISYGRSVTDPYNTFGNTCTQKKPMWSECTGPVDPVCDTLVIEDNLDIFNSDTCKCSDRKMKTYGYHEPEHWYQMCLARDRNGGLFTGSQNPGVSAKNTRQEPNSARYGFECTEERDYWPYWHPTPWYDLAVITNNMTLCHTQVQESQNVKDKCHCVHPDETVGPDTPEQYEAYKFNQADSCKNAGYKWDCYGRWNWPVPECVLTPEQIDNRLGSPMGNYQWTIPESLLQPDQDETTCVLRIRYNISTSETPIEFDFLDNLKVKQNPVELYQNVPIRMAINTAQYGRTFEDRTYVFKVARKPSGINRVHNLNVRGKRGNIAQVRNCVEYDFIPSILHVTVGDHIHFQWCGSDYNPNGNAGEGRQGTDRSNVVRIEEYNRNIPYLNGAPIFSDSDILSLAWLNQEDKYCYTIEEMLATQDGNDPKSCHFLNGVRSTDGIPTAYFTHLAEVKSTGTFMFMSSRNNNFSNRSQKGVVVSHGSTTGEIIGVIVSVAIIITSVTALVVYIYITKIRIVGRV